MTVEEIVYRIKTNLQFSVVIAYNNNPTAITHNLTTKFGNIFANEEGAVIDFIFNILEIGTDQEKQMIMESLKVPFIEDNATDSLKEAYNIIISEARLKNNNT